MVLFMPSISLTNF